MKNLLSIFTAIAFVIGGATASYGEDSPKYALVIHGGAGTITPDKLSDEVEADIRAKLAEALAAGEAILKAGGTALDAVSASVQVLENSHHFNAGKGAVFTSEGEVELDAAIMDGSDLNAGAVTGVQGVKNPITLARAVMEKSHHVMFSGGGGNRFAKENGIEMVDKSYFHTDYRWQQLQRARSKETAAKKMKAAPTKVAGLDLDIDYKFGTVGAAALDIHGNLAAGTSTGGMTNKQYGRVGDAPIIGAGTYANNNSCAVSATGHGEYFIRATVASRICARMELAGETLEQAANSVVMDQLVKMGADGGIIAVDKDGNMSLTFNSAGMYRGKVSSDLPAQVGIYKMY